MSNALKSVRYDGPHDGVDLSGYGTCMRGGTIDVPASVAASLVEQDCWSYPPAKKSTPRKRAAKKTAAPVTTSTTKTTEEAGA